MPADDILVVYKVDKDSFIADSKKAQDAAKGVGTAGVKAGADTSKALKDAGKGASDFGGIMDSLGKKLVAAFAVERIIAFGREAVNAFSEAEASANRLSFAIENVLNATKRDTAALLKQSQDFQKNSIFSDDAIQQAQLALATYGLLPAEIKKLIPVLVDLSSKNGDLQGATQAAINTIQTGRNSLKEYGINVSDVATREERLNIILERGAKFQGASRKEIESTSGQIKKLNNEIDEQLEKSGEKLAPFLTKLKEIYAREVRTFSNFIVAVSGGSAQEIDEELQARFDAARGASKESIAQEIKTTDQIRKEVLQRLADEIGIKRLTIEQLKFLDTIAARDELDRRTKQNEELDKLAKERAARQIRDLQALLDALNRIGLDGIKDETAKKIFAENIAFEKERDGLKKLDLMREEDRKKRNAALEQLEINHQDKITKIIEDAEKERLRIEVRAGEKELEVANENAEATQKNFEAARKRGINETDDLRIEILRSLNSLTVEEQKELNDLLEKRNQAYISKGQELVSATIAQIQVIADARKEAIDREITEADERIRRQEELADRGLANTLSQEEARRSQLEKQRIEEERKMRHIKELEIFFNSIASFIQGGDKPFEAIAKAGAVIGAAEIAAAVFAEEGGVLGATANERSSGRRHRGGGDIFVHAQTGEGILSRDRVKAIGGVAGFSALEEAIDTGIFRMPKMPVGIPVAVSGNRELISEFRELKNEFRKIKTVYTNIDGLGNIVEVAEQAGKKVVTRKIRNWR